MTTRESNRQSLIKLSPLRGVFGYPPSTYVSDDMIINSMPVLQIYPSLPVFQSGLTLFRVQDAWDEYSTTLKAIGYEIADQPRGPLELAFIADSFPTESFSNDYGESFLQKFTDVASQGMSEITQMMGAREFTEAMGKMAGGLSAFGEQQGGLTGTVVGGAGDLIKKSRQGLEALRDAASNSNSAVGKAFGGGIDVLNKLMAGHRVDFPVVWRNAGFNPNYQVTIRLYNPNPGSLRRTKENIMGPLAAILLLGIPGSEDGKTYTWPYYHRIKCEGIFDLQPAVITNITVIKGGDQQQLAYNQRVSIVDVRIDFRTVFSSMLYDRSNNILTGRPNLSSYINQFGEDANRYYVKRNKMRNNAVARSGVNVAANPELINLETPDELAQRNALQATKDNGIRRRQTEAIEVATTSRVSSSDQSTQAALVQQATNEGIVIA